MINYVIYIVVTLILLFIIYLAINALVRGIKVKKENKKSQYNLKNKNKY
tara:strand:- start:40 stop:186 length:147 start_codon:yes stop_codon:yes gene_type:complete